MNVMIVCREHLYERLKAPIPMENEVSPALNTLDEVIGWIQTQQNGIDLLVIDTGLPSYETICSLPYRHYKYDGDPNYESVIVGMISALALAKESTRLPVSTQSAEPHQDLRVEEQQHFNDPLVETSHEAVKELPDDLVDQSVSTITTELDPVEPRHMETEVFDVPVMPQSMKQDRNPLGFFTQAIGRGREVIEQVKNQRRTASPIDRPADKLTQKSQAHRELLAEDYAKQQTYDGQ